MRLLLAPLVLLCLILRGQAGDFDMGALTASEQAKFRDKLLIEGANDDLSQQAVLQSLQAATLPDEPLPPVAARSSRKGHGGGGSSSSSSSSAGGVMGALLGGGGGGGIGSQIDGMFNKLRAENTAMKGQVKSMRSRLMGVNEHRTQDDQRVANLQRENKLLRTSYRSMKAELERQGRRQRAMFDLMGADPLVRKHAAMNATLRDV